MHPALLGKRQATMIVMGEPSEPEPRDPLMDLMFNARDKNLSGCLKALAAIFEDVGESSDSD